MVDVFPRRNLPAPAEPWGREHDNRVLNLEQGVEALNQGLSGQNRNTASSLSLISQQLRDIQDAQQEISSQVTLSHEAEYDYTVALGDPLPFNTGELAPISFSISERRNVYFRASCYFGISASYDGSSPLVFPQGFVRMLIRRVDHTNGTPDGVTNSPVAIGTGANLGQTSYTLQTQRSFLDDYQTLNPGDYTVSFSSTVVLLDGTSGTIQIFNPRLTVQVLEKA